MDIKIREPLYVYAQGHEYVVRQGTVGVERNKVLFFYDNTRTVAVGFARDYCLENPQTFQVAKTLADKEVPKRDIFKILDDFRQGNCSMDTVYEQIKAL